MYNKEGGRSRVSYSNIMYRDLYSCWKRARSMTFMCGVIVVSRIIVVTHRACHAVANCSECLMRACSMHAKAACACHQYAESAYQQSRMVAML